MSKIPPKAITHKLNIDPRYKPIQQKKRSFVLKRQKVIDEEVDKVLATIFLQEAHYLNWLVNVEKSMKSGGSISTTMTLTRHV